MRLGSINPALPLQVLVLLSCTAQLLLWASEVSPLVRGAPRHWQRILVPSFTAMEADGFAPPTAERRILVEPEQLLKVTQEFVRQFAALGSEFVENFRHAGDRPGQVLLTVVPGKNSGGNATQISVWISESGEGEIQRALGLGEKSLAEFIQSTEIWELNAHVISVQFIRAPVPVLWNLKLVAKMSDQKENVVEFKVSRGKVVGDYAVDAARTFRNLTILSYIVMMLAAASFVQQLRAIIIRSLKLSFLTAISLIADIFCFVGDLLLIPSLRTQIVQLDDRILLALGLGCAFSMIRMLAAIEFLSKDYNGLVHSLSSAAPFLFPIITSILPLYLGYAMLATSIFAYQGYEFANFGYSFQTLFALMNGDSVLNVAVLVGSDFPISGTIFLVSFFLLIVFNCGNIILAKIQETYFAVFPPASGEMLQFRTVDSGTHSSTPLDLLPKCPRERIGKMLALALTDPLRRLSLDFQTRMMSNIGAFQYPVHLKGQVPENCAFLPNCWLCLLVVKIQHVGLEILSECEELILLKKSDSMSSKRNS